MKKISQLILLSGLCLILAQPNAQSDSSSSQYWMKIKATDKFERSVLANDGIAIEIVQDGYVIAYGSKADLQRVQSRGWLIASSDLLQEAIFQSSQPGTTDFPSRDAAYHNYQELTAELNKLATENPDLMKVSSIGKTIENRDLWLVELTAGGKASEKPAVVYMGGHHAREHLSVEMPLKWVQFLISEYKKNNDRIVTLLQNRTVYVIPVVNPDGKDHDISDSNYKVWRKNRARNSNGTFGVDLNRNYGFQWGTGGSSNNPNQETYMGPKAFSENVTTLLSFHSFSKLILYPWGHKYDSIGESKDLAVHEKMAEQMSKWNGYAPQQSSELYIASGDTTDWSYGVHKIISFTFELDPQGGGFGGSQGFYPGPNQIEPSFQKNLEPMLYLLEYADNPYRVLSVGIGPINP
jgi:carboxypeptidase T